VYVLSVYAAGLADVYNLSVSGIPEYFANGVLVHNCDALRYGLVAEAMPQPEKSRKLVFG
jgi:hypothetical protein